MLQWAYIVKGMRDEQLAQQRQRIAKDPERVAAFERGLAEGGYEGAQRASPTSWRHGTRRPAASRTPEPRRVYMPCGIALRYVDAGDYGRAIDWLEKAYEVRDPELALQLRRPLCTTLCAPTRASRRWRAGWAFPRADRTALPTSRRFFS